MVYEAVLFDMDGTLLNTLTDLTDSLNYVLAENGFPTHKEQDVKSFLGNGVRFLISSALPQGVDQAAAERVLNAFKERYAQHIQDKTSPYEGIMPLLHSLKNMGVRTAIVSNKFDDAVKLLNEDYFSGLVESAVGESKSVRRKPAPDGVLAALRKLSVVPEKALYVGDSEVDVQTARNAGIKCVGVTWGFRDQKVLEEAKADYIISRPEELLSIVENG